MVPSGWEVKRFEEVAYVGNGQVDPREEPYLSMFHIGPENISSNSGQLNGIKKCSDLKLVSGKYEFDKNAIVYSKIRPNLNKICRPDFSGVCSADMYPIWAKTDLNIDYLFYYMLGDSFYKTAVSMSMRTGMPKINRKDLDAININIPPLPEQQKIAKILTIWDKAINTTERLIDNSKQQKKALMQQLLTGQKRLLDDNGKRFEGEWKEHSLNNVAKIIVSPVDKKIKDDEIPVQLCNYTDVYYNIRIKKSLDFMDATAKQSEIDRFTLQVGDVIITKDSETPEDIAVPALVSEDLNGVVCGYHLAIIRPNEEKVTGAFINYLFATPEIGYYFFSLANGATRFGLTIGSIEKAKFKLPSIKEQQKIATVLTNADREIELLEQQLADLQQEKKALMQQLLTGKKRVLVD